MKLNVSPVFLARTGAARQGRGKEKDIPRAARESSGFASFSAFHRFANLLDYRFVPRAFPDARSSKLPLLDTLDAPLQKSLG